MIISEDSKKRFENTLRTIQWIRNICEELPLGSELGMFRPEDIKTTLEAIEGIEDAAEKLLLNDELEALEALANYVDKIHTEVIERTQTVYIGSKEGSERFLSGIQKEIEQYGFYKNGMGIKVVYENGDRLSKDEIQKNE